MAWVDRLFGRKRTTSAAAAAETTQARRQDMVGRDPGQSADEQAATRQRMEAEMDAQRLRRTPTPPADS
jgi:hypothetical protein